MEQASPSAGRVARPRRRVVLRGEVDTDPSPTSGCRFAPRCAFAMDVCRQVDPVPFGTGSGATVRCHLHTEGPALAGGTVLALGPAGASAP